MTGLKEILQLLTMAEAFAERLEEIWKEINGFIEKEKDEKKREALLDACGRRDAGAVRRILFE